jgi:hypothetical protein
VRAARAAEPSQLGGQRYAPSGRSIAVP